MRMRHCFAVDPSPALPLRRGGCGWGAVWQGCIANGYKINLRWAGGRRGFAVKSQLKQPGDERAVRWAARLRGSGLRQRCALLKIAPDHPLVITSNGLR